MAVDEDTGQVTLSLSELKKHLDERGQRAQDVAVAGTAILTLVGNAVGFRWSPWLFLSIALGRLLYAWRKERPKRAG